MHLCPHCDSQTQHCGMLVYMTFKHQGEEYKPNPFVMRKCMDCGGEFYSYDDNQQQQEGFRDFIFDLNKEKVDAADNTATENL